MPNNDIKNTTVIGAGAMGNGIAQVLAMAGYQVIMVDVDQAFVDKGMETIARSLDFRINRGTMTEEQKTELLTQRLSTSLDVKKSVVDAQVVIEAVPEKMDLKKDLFQTVAAAAPETALLATNTSTMSITEIATAVTQPGRFVGMHFFNPVPAMKLVEVTAGEKTTEATLDRACELTEAIRKIPVRVLKDSPGFIVNRISAPNMALINVILDEGKVRPDAVDAVMRRTGMTTAPFEMADFVGIDVYYNVLSYYAQTLSPDYTPGRVLNELIARGDLGMKTGQGIYTWVDGKAQIDLSQPSTDITPLEFLSIQINEAVRVYKEGIARSIDDIDMAMIHGMRSIAGPFVLTAGMDHQQIADTLNRLRERFGLSIYQPEPEIMEGSFKEWGKPAA